MEAKDEKTFLKEYNVNKYFRPSVTSDILLFSISNGQKKDYRRLNEKHLSVLLVKRKNHPFKDMWCLPGGFVKENETTEESSRRILKDETNLENIFMEQLYTFDDIKRDPRTRVISVSYMALVNKNKLTNILNENAIWFNIMYLEDEKYIYVTLDNSNEIIKFKVKKELKDKTTNTYKYEIIDNNSIAFDHALAIVTGIQRLKNKVMYTDIAFNMMNEYFTLGELQQVYEILLGKKLLDPAFRRIIANKVVKTDKLKTGEGHRPSVLFKYKENK